MRKKLYIIADTTDNTITLSSALCQALEVTKGDPRIFVFKLSQSKKYALKRVPVGFANKTIVGIVSKNPISGTIGFVSNCPTVQLMFYEMKIKSRKKRLKIQKQILPDESVIYVIKPPKQVKWPWK